MLVVDTGLAHERVQGCRRLFTAERSHEGHRDPVTRIGRQGSEEVEGQVVSPREIVDDDEHPPPAGKLGEHVGGLRSSESGVPSHSRSPRRAPLRLPPLSWVPFSPSPSRSPSDSHVAMLEPEFGSGKMPRRGLRRRTPPASGLLALLPVIERSGARKRRQDDEAVLVGIRGNERSPDQKARAFWPRRRLELLRGARRWRSASVCVGARGQRLRVPQGTVRKLGERCVGNDRSTIGRHGRNHRRGGCEVLARFRNCKPAVRSRSRRWVRTAPGRTRVSTRPWPRRARGPCSGRRRTRCSRRRRTRCPSWSCTPRRRP